MTDRLAHYQPLIQAMQNVTYRNYIYIMSREGDEFLKIGRSGSIRRRRSSIQTALRRKIKIEYRRDFGLSVIVAEGTLHKMFSEQRRDGEWFAVSLDDVKKAIDILHNHIGRMMPVRISEQHHY